MEVSVDKRSVIARTRSGRDYFTNVTTINSGTGETFEQVNSDWNATEGKAQILNKPDLGTFAAKYFWSGTLSAYNAILTKDANTIYFVEE